MPRKKGIKIKNKKDRRRQQKIFTNKRRHRSILFPCFIVVSVMLLISIYVYFENTQVQLNAVPVSIPALPSQLEGFTILHMSDLNGKYFGQEQTAIKSALSGKKFNLCVYTGDFAAPGGDTDDFIALITAMGEYGKNFYYITGESDPPLTSLVSVSEYDYNDTYARIKNAGGIYLEVPVRIAEYGEGALWLMPFSALTTDPVASSRALDTVMADYARQNTPEAMEALADCRFKQQYYVRLEEALSQMQASVLLRSHIRL